MSTENAPVESLSPGDRLSYRGLDVTVIGERQPDDNQFGLPWFKYAIRADDGRLGFARFGPGGHVARYVEGVTA